jgi:hypothetical protein
MRNGVSVALDAMNICLTPLVNVDGGRFTSILKPTKPGAKPTASTGPLVGRWPESILLLIAKNLPLPDLPQLARANRAFSRIVRDERGWEARCKLLKLDPDGELTVRHFAECSPSA